jgi:spermidine synthase
MIPIAKIDSPFGEITVLRNRRTGAVRYDQGSTHQSEADSRGISLVAYIHAIFDLLLQAGCRDVLMIGCGGGTLATLLHGAGAHVAIVDIDSWSFRLARQYFGLPPTVPCHAVDGAAFLRGQDRRYDAIVLDAYEDNRMPAQFADAGFLALVRQRLADAAGLFIANLHVIDDGDPAAEDYAAAMAKAWPDVRLLDAAGRKNRNALALAGRVAGLMRPVLRQPPSSSAAEIEAELARLTFREPRAGMARGR